MKRPIKPRKPLKTTKRGFFMLMLGKELVYSIYDRNKLKNLQNITDTLRLEYCGGYRLLQRQSYYG
jgi:hypothetical protein